MRIVECIGSPEARGHAHGEALRDLIEDALNRWEAATMAALGSKAPDDFATYCSRFLSDTRCLNHAEAATPDLYAELRAIAEGADQPFSRIAAYNLMDEQWWYDSTIDLPPPGCSLVASEVPGGHVLAQNMDLPGHMHGSQVALRLGGPDMPETVALSAAGLLGLTGANEAGLAVGVNTLLMLHHDRAGLPVAFALRHTLAARDRDEAARRLSRTSHASGQHYALASRSGITSFECSAAGCTPFPQVSPLLHTNHPLCSRDIDARSQKRLDKSGFNASSRARLDWLSERRNDLGSPAALRALFDDAEAPLCMRPETHSGSSTFSSVLYELTSDVVVHMRKGIAGNDRWRSFGFDPQEGS